ncbi:hypothetical protein BpHYR1_021978 [Brachionus plicatilis]|uniref:Uncharacterized protein n=1 Tax=Brachionus plicatilis TaxID=10195 RepID=A0A3M7QMG4_BRAPC|nr:hypothetical protein BpHYR1_021978 [Brachionus plicatilis]
MLNDSKSSRQRYQKYCLLTDQINKETKKSQFIGDKSLTAAQIAYCHFKDSTGLTRLLYIYENQKNLFQLMLIFLYTRIPKSGLRPGPHTDLKTYVSPVSTQTLNTNRQKPTNRNPLRELNRQTNHTKSQISIASNIETCSNQLSLKKPVYC